ncbi:CHAT domain-containing protein [Nocardia stercoris]|uniref:CHAT domain-containing protein n=2 Tax=Nocardia stercoris TaxID=2483361 RepID=A0A3M2L9Y6_9NOCA|nr:CHAT domain-containing protein [Nocardia stercoris]
MADAGELYLYWQWGRAVSEPGIAVVPEDQVVALVERVAAALPNPTRPDGLESALTASELVDPVAELDLAQQLSRTFLPYRLAEQLYRYYTAGVRPRIRIQPSPRVAQIPWELMAPDPAVRLLDLADISQLAPAGLIHTPGRTQRSWGESADLPRVAVLDPRVPGFRADSALGSVLGRMAAESPLLQRVEKYRQRDLLRPKVDSAVEAFRRSDVDREWLSDTLRSGAARLLYVGHVTAAAPETGLSELARLHLACRDDTDGWAEPERTHRPLSARDLILGGPGGAPGEGPRHWPIPSRVALIACESGGDLRFGEPLGLVAAMLHGGAELVTAGRWALPTDLAFHRFAGAESHTHPLQEAICAIDAAHEAADPVRALNDWQRARLAAWRAGGSVVDSPLLWAAFTTVCSPAPQVS